MRVIMSSFVFVMFLLTRAYSQDTLSMDIVGDRFLIVDAAVNDSIEARFLFDTGGGLEVVSNRLFRRLDGTAEAVGVITGFRSTGQRVDLELYRIPSMTVGTLRKQNLTIAPFPELDGYEDFDGILSLKFFENQAVTLDFSARKIILESVSSLKVIKETAEVISIYEKTNSNVELGIMIPLIVNDNLKILAEFDTGTGIEYMMNPYYLKTIVADTSAIPRNDWTGSDGVVQRMYLPTVSSMRLENSKLVSGHNLQVTCLENFIYQGCVGWQLFKDRLVTVDCPGKQMLIR